MNKIMTVTGALLLGATWTFLFFQLEGSREAMHVGIAYLAGMVTAALPAIDHIFPHRGANSL